MSERKVTMLFSTPAPCREENSSAEADWTQFQEMGTNPTARINVGDVHFCKLWICCSFTIVFFMLWQCCVYDPVRFRHKSHLVMVGKHCFLAWNSCFGHHEHSRKCPKADTNTAGNCHQGFLKISSVFMLQMSKLSLVLWSLAWQPSHL